MLIHFQQHDAVESDTSVADTPIKKINAEKILDYVINLKQLFSKQLIQIENDIYNRGNNHSPKCTQ